MSPASEEPVERTCGAKLRGGGFCMKAARPGQPRCRSHGCAPGAGAPKGNKNALKHGRCTAERRAALPGKGIAKQIRESRVRSRKIMREAKKHKGKAPTLALPRSGRWSRARLYWHVGSLLIKQEAYCRRVEEAGYIGFIDEERAKADLLRDLCDFSEVFETQCRFETSLKLLLKGPVLGPNGIFFPNRYREAWYELCRELIEQSRRSSLQHSHR